MALSISCSAVSGASELYRRGLYIQIGLFNGQAHFVPLDKRQIERRSERSGGITEPLLKHRCACVQ